jgi:hypothetical protein
MPSGPPVRGHATRRCPIRTAATFLFCALLCAEGLAAGKPAPNKASRPHAGDVRPAGRKKARRPASTKPTEPAETTQSGEATATQPSQAADDRQTVAIVLSRLGRTRRSQMSDRDVALKAALEFVRALGRADGQKAAGLLEVTGYQILPSGGEPPEEPGPRISPEAFATDVAARKPASFETLPPPDLPGCRGLDAAGRLGGDPQAGARPRRLAAARSLPRCPGARGQANYPGRYGSGRVAWAASP